MDTQTLAIYFAGAAHQEQMYGESPYVFHLAAADTVLRDAGYQVLHPVRIAIWLHDIVEDTTVTLEQIEKRFGKYISNLVYAVTNEPGTRKERAKDTYLKISAWGEDAIAIKLADRIANMENSLRTFSRFGMAYVREDIVFRNYLYGSPETEERLVYLWERYMKVVMEIKDMFGGK
jgi:(p)ppGpp synthase/HD superfamily hydrolase